MLGRGRSSRRPPAGPGVALHGAGLMASVHGVAAAELGLRITTVASRTRTRAEELAARFGARVVEPGEIPDPDSIVVVATPPADHATAALRYLDAGAAVVVEKPLCRTLAEADALVEASDRHEGRLLYAENLAYGPLVVEFLRRARAIDRITYLEARCLQGRPTWGEFLTAEWGGGALFDLGVHPLALILLASTEDPVWVEARLEGADDHPTDEWAEVVLGFASGARARLISSWRHDADAVWDLQAVGEHDVVRGELRPASQLVHNGEDVAVPTGPARPTELTLLHEAGYVGQLAAFLDDLAARRPPVTDARFGRRVLEVVHAAYRSAGLGRRVALPFDGPRDRTPLAQWRN
ncbi:MAG: Gfo/Idh/MocA family oxidoreductase [Ilumatobacteraceae bacterium]